MSLYKDVEYMLYRSQESRLKIEQTLRSFKRKILEHGEAALYQGFEDKVKYNLCCSRILQGNFSQWDGWQFRDDWAAAMKYGVKTIPFWDGNYTEHLIVVGEQGVGDEVLFGSVIPEAQIRCKKVSYACDERMVDIFSRSLRIDCKTRYVDARDDLIGGYSSYIPAGDLFPLFRKRKEDFPKKPFLKPLPERVREFEQYRGRTGISWRGRHGFIDPRDLGIENPLSLQYDELRFDGSEGIETPSCEGMRPLDLRNDLEGVIALISVLDRVVCVPTSVMHFAGGQSVPCDIIKTSPESEKHIDGVFDEMDWHVPGGESPFYSNSTVFENIEEWKNVRHGR